MGNVEAGARAGEPPGQSVPRRFDYTQLSPKDARLFAKMMARELFAATAEVAANIDPEKLAQ